MLRHCDPLGNWQLSSCHPIGVKAEVRGKIFTRFHFLLISEGSVLIFVTRKAHSVEVAEKLKARDLKVLLIHGDMHQSERNTVIHKFKHQEAPILVATDVACKCLVYPLIALFVSVPLQRLYVVT